jgi:hypothetical protein
VADHLSRLLDEVQSQDRYVIKEEFPDEQLLAITGANTPWYAHIVNYLVSNIVPPELNFQKEKDFYIKLRNISGMNLFSIKNVLTKC